ncbi:MAG: Cd(II)/Pb(II)-responsive transcriptional regulator [Pseudomonadales bacterium]|uniref:MerR family transcriptional regulator n=1 Tax=Oleiphilus messinensis TaxID=141451 RepID=A0A1Y0I6A5_9GAMM|nr:Cd(II)/Pb(II)-responsive transcriptional regulator [Oleiphilus messinensis]ARU55760.1 MerR family transcriptional regulator [Oleiphilus messinensis]MCG8614381.1 Cd(II)/Pb(II)-responsive transcriptional regulator [Pseudomonadales bacterium]
MRIGELGKLCGVKIETIRYYEREGLLPEPTREHNGYRRYSQSHLERLSFIRHCRVLDMPLEDIRVLLEFMQSPPDQCQEIDELLEKQLVRVQTRLLSLHALQNQLQQLRAQCVDGASMEPCGILEELVSAAKGEGCICHSD